jgi:hypothetical protein
MVTWLNRLQNLGLATRAVLLASAVFAAFAAVGPFAAHLGGPTALWAAAVGGFLCLAGATCALVAGHFLRSPHFAFQALLVGMALRVSIPLGIGAALYLRGGPLAEAGLLYYLVVFYVVTLTVETALSLPPGQRPGEPSPQASKGAS